MTADRAGSASERSAGPVLHGLSHVALDERIRALEIRDGQSNLEDAVPRARRQREVGAGGVEQPPGPLPQRAQPPQLGRAQVRVQPARGVALPQA